MGQQVEIAVVGAGPVGLAAALALSRSGFDVALVAPQSGPVDRRTSALLGGSIDLLQELEVWSQAVAVAAPLRVMRIIDATARLIRAPEVTFQASEIGRTEFGFNIANAALVEALNEAIEGSSVKRIQSMVSAVAITPEAVVLDVESGTVSAQLAIGADGRRSRLRQAAGITTRNWSYDQSALVCNLDHEYHHEHTSTEFHTENGPFTLVPLAKNKSSLVWIDAPGETERRAGLGPSKLAQEIEDRSAYILGRIEIDGQTQTFPLGGMSTDRFAEARIMLAGESAHLFPPIGAQGLNLGYRDVAALMEVLPGRVPDPGSQPRLDAYNRARRGDVRMRTLAVDSLNRTLLSDFLPAQGLRGSGLFALDRFPALRRWAMQSGLGAGQQERPTT